MTNINMTRAKLLSWKMASRIKPKNKVIMTREIDANNLIRLRKTHEELQGIRPSYTALIIKAAALTLEQNPHANRRLFRRWWGRLYMHQFKEINISVAIDRSDASYDQYYLTQNYLIEQTLEQSLEDITKKLRVVAKDVSHPSWEPFRRLSQLPLLLSWFLLKQSIRTPKTWSKYMGCGAWVNSPSRDGADLVMTAWPFPITFSFGLVKERPFVRNGTVVVTPTIPLIMAFDRRIMGGGPASRVFADFINILQNADQTLIGLLEAERISHTDK